MAQTQTKTEVVVKFALMDYHYRTHKPQGFVTAGPFRTAKKAASEFAYHVAMDFAHRYPKKYRAVIQSRFSDKTRKAVYEADISRN